MIALNSECMQKRAEWSHADAEKLTWAVFSAVEGRAAVAMLRRSAKRFKDAQGAPMPLKGEVELVVHIGDMPASGRTPRWEKMR